MVRERDTVIESEQEVVRDLSNVNIPVILSDT